MKPQPFALTARQAASERAMHESPLHQSRYAQMYSPNGNLTLNETTVSGGVASGSFPANRGGGVFNNYGVLTLMHSTVTGNSADDLAWDALLEHGPFACTAR